VRIAASVGAVHRGLVSIATWKGQSSMIRRFIACSVGAGLIVSGALFTAGCSDDPGQASRESISAPRKGGGALDPSADAAKGKKAKGVPGGKLGGKRGAD
jgi:hypothetical protein